MIPGIPEGPRRKAFRTFVQQIQGSPTFRNGRIVKPTSWRLWNGVGPVSDPTTDMMPVVMLRLIGGPIERLATMNDQEGDLPTVDISTRLTVVIETWVKGNNADDAMDLFDAIDAALFPVDQAARVAIFNAFQAVGVSDWMPMRDVLPETVSDYGAAHIHSVGAYEFVLNLTQ